MRKNTKPYKRKTNDIWEENDHHTNKILEALLLRALPQTVRPTHINCSMKTKSTKTQTR